jgi:beta-lactam-binding protein with PASTA domain/tRNA A-37 threonylcarbamoyl transferase component Bud32
MVVQHLSDEVGRVLGGRYRLIAPIGAGASARVFVADDVTLRRRVAVKILHAGLAHDEEFLRRFRAEAQAAASLSHPHVLGVFDWGHDDVPYLVTEFLAGGSLRSMLDAGHRLTPSQALLVGLEAARGLEYAHGQGLVHRDIKPANLLFDTAGRLRIADFGLARALAEAGWTDPAGEVVGTARYAAPEQAQGTRMGLKADVYALALVINESVTGAVPFVADSVAGTLMARVDSPIDPGPELGPLQGPVRRAGRVDPDERIDAGELATALMASAEGLTRPDPLPLVGALNPDLVPDEAADLTQLGVATAAGADLVRPIDDTSRRRWPWLVLVGLMAVAAAVAGTYAWLTNQTETVEVPDLVGLSYVEAQAALADVIAEVNPLIQSVDVREPGTVRGEVVETDPAAGESIEEGGEITIYVSLGEPLRTLPEVRGQTVAEATLALQLVDLTVGDTVEVNDEELAAGLVLGFDVASGVTEVEVGTAVDLIVSDGPEDRSVPPIPADGSLEVAKTDLANARLTFVEELAYSDDVPEGQVVEYSPRTGAVVPADSEVTIVVSQGPEPREIPNVIALSVAEATAELEELGFVVTGTVGSPSLPVLATDPPAGESHLPGTEVIIATELPDP